MKEIIDDLTARTDISHQRKSQIRNVRKGKCQYCGKPRVNKSHCETCRAIVAARNLARYRRLHPPEVAKIRRAVRMANKHLVLFMVYRQRIIALEKELL